MTESRPPLLRVANLLKSYAAPVLRDLDLTLHHREIHAFMGANGAGKSTLAKIVAGLVKPDSGTLFLDGVTYAPQSKSDAERSGVVLVLQELNLLGTLSIAENLCLDRLPRRWGLIDRGELRRQARRALARVGLDQIDPDLPASALGIGQQQLVEIARALSRHCKLLLLDEPTAALTDPEITTLFEHLRRLTDAGVGILYISHRLDEIQRIADRVSVLRDGERVATHVPRDLSPAQLVREMSGHELAEPKRRTIRTDESPVLQVANLTVGPRVRDLSFHVRRGEIVGLAGLVGAGRTETLRAIFGADRVSAGSVQIGSSPRRLFRNPSEAVAAGLGLIPEDRKREGLLLPQSIRVNATLATVSRFARWGWLRRDREFAAASRSCDQLDVRRASLDQPIAELSGGNQQKVILARWLERDCSVLLCDEPTRGVDAATKDAIHELLREFAEQGRGVLVASSELTELMSLCDRILVLSNGRLAGEFRDGQWTQTELNAAAFRYH